MLKYWESELVCLPVWFLPAEHNLLSISKAQSCQHAAAVMDHSLSPNPLCYRFEACQAFYSHNGTYAVDINNNV